MTFFSRGVGAAPIKTAAVFLPWTASSCISFQDTSLVLLRKPSERYGSQPTDSSCQVQATALILMDATPTTTISYS